MTKIMLVEDDKSLREIYGIRLVAEGYEIVSAGDGEEALAMAVKEHPDLILADVMMPKISGFDMLDILRATPETKDVKVVMMTALSSEDQRARGEALGANRYLVKSQVGIEDVVRTIRDVLAGTTSAPEQPNQPQPAPTTETPVAPIPQPSAQVPTAPNINAASQPAPLPNPEPPITPEMQTPHAQITPTPHSEPSVFKDRNIEPMPSATQSNTPDIAAALAEPTDAIPAPPPPPTQI